MEQQFYIAIPFLMAICINRYFILALFLIITFPLVSIVCYNFPSLLATDVFSVMLVKLVNYSFWKGPIILLIGSMASFLTFKGIINLN